MKWLEMIIFDENYGFEPAILWCSNRLNVVLVFLYMRSRFGEGAGMPAEKCTGQNCVHTATDMSD